MTYRQLHKTGVGFILIAFIATSCASVNTIKLDTLRPAGYSVPPEILSVVIMDHSYPFRGDSVNVIKVPGETIVVDTIWVDDFGQRAINNLAAVLVERDFFDSVYVHPELLNKPPTGAPLAMPGPNLIDSIAEVYNAQAVVALEMVNYKTIVNVGDFAAYYYITLDANGSLFWKLYARNGYVMDVFLQKDSIYWSDAQSTLRNAIRGVPHMRDAIENLADFMGQQYSNRLSPYWEQIERTYFSGGHFLFNRANDLVRVNNWIEAAKVWYYVYETGNKNQKARAAYNIAISWELRGDFEEAVAWADISRQLFDEMSLFRASQYYKNISVMYYLDILERRNEGRKLNEQLGGGNL